MSYTVKKPTKEIINTSSKFEEGHFIFTINHKCGETANFNIIIHKVTKCFIHLDLTINGDKHYYITQKKNRLMIQNCESSDSQCIVFGPHTLYSKNLIRE